MKTSRYVAPVLACLLLLPLLLRDCAFAAPAQDNPDEEKIWRVIYVEGGPFSDYQRIFQGLALGLEERGLIENGHVPLPKDSEEARGMWEWLHQHAGGKRLVFLADGFYSANWDSQQREKVRQEVLRRIREKKDVDMVLAFGTWAGQDLAAQDLPVPVIVSSVTNAVDAGIIPSVEDSGRDIPEAEDFRMLPGRGVSARVDGHALLAGNAALLQDNGIALSPTDKEEAQRALDAGQSLVYVALDGRFAGFIALADSLRNTAAATLQGLRDAGVSTMLLTGDNEAAAHSVSAGLALDGVRANCLPADKLEWIADSQRQERPVCMIGDGINDAPALKKAFVGVAMGGIGSDIAVDAADMALVHDDIKELPHIFTLSRRMMRTITLNLSFSMILNFAAIFLAMGGLLSPVLGALVHNAGSVLVIINSALLLNWRHKEAGR